MNQQYSNPFGFTEEARAQKISRQVRDPIHGYLEFSKPIWQIIDTPQFQRLRYIKQLGFVSYVFPGATHSRFEHCLGTAHLARTLMQHIVANHKNNYQQLGFKDSMHFQKIKLIVTLSGLLHDIGHGPFSHSFDRLILPSIGLQEQWQHEDGSEMMIEDLFQTFNIVETFDKQFGIQWTHEDTQLLQLLIQPDGDFYQTEKYAGKMQDYEKIAWIFEIVANKRNSIDVDQFDYLARDSYYSGIVNTKLDFEIFMKQCRVIQNQICYPRKQANHIYDLFYTRKKMHIFCYQHRVIHGLELMFKDIMVEMNRLSIECINPDLRKDIQHFDLNQAIHNPQVYIHLTDSVIEDIYKLVDLKYTEEKELDKVRNLLVSFQNRSLYRYLTQMLITQNEQKFDNMEIIRDEFIEFLQRSQGFNEYFFENIELIKIEINYSLKDQNPVETTGFYQDSNIKQVIHLQKEEVSSMLPQKFSETWVRIYFKDVLNHVVEDLINLKELFTKFIQDQTGIVGNNHYSKEILTTTPSKEFFNHQTSNGSTTKSYKQNHAQKSIDENSECSEEQPSKHIQKQ